MEVIAYANYFSLFYPSLLAIYRAPRNVVATFTQSVTRWRYRKAKFVQSCNFDFFQKNMLSLFDTMLNFVVNLLENERDPRQDQ
jgi:hypothetical protein